MTNYQQKAETALIKHLINDVYPSGIVSLVSDSFDFWYVISEASRKLKSDIMSRDGKVVFRPDSGDPVYIICGDDDALEDTPEYKGAVECLWDIFGGTITSTGHKLLDSHVGLIYGDSITLDRAFQILEILEQKGFASGNVVFGIGSYTYQYVTRDTFGCAVKATYGIVDGVARNICKNPKTDSGVKKSAKGLLAVTNDNGTLKLQQECSSIDMPGDELKEVFRDGKLLIDHSLSEIRQRIGATQ